MIPDFKAYLRRHFPADTLLSPRNADSQRLAFNQYKMPESFRWLMFFLKFSPWVCFVGFSLALSILLLARAGAGFEPLAGITRFEASYHAVIEFINMLSVSGLIGYGTNYLAIQMLFKPVVRRPVWGQGLIPAQRERIIFTLAQGMHKHILNQDLIRQRIEETGLVHKISALLLGGTAGLIRDTELRAQLKQLIINGMADYAARDDVRQEMRSLIDNRIEQNLDGGMKKFLLQSYKRFNRADYEGMMDKVVAEIPSITREALTRVEQELEGLADAIEQQQPEASRQIMQLMMDLLERLDITDLLARQMEHFDEQKLERMIWEATNEQLLYIQYLGAVLGILGGLIIWKPEVMGPLFILAVGLLYLADEGIYRWKNRTRES